MTAPVAPSNFVTLVKRAYQEMGLVNAAPSTCQDQVNMAGKVVNWVLAAHADIQQTEDAWRFDWATVTKVLAANVDTITPGTDWGVSAKEWVQRDGAAYVYNTITGLTTRQWLQFIDFNVFRGLNVPVVPGQAPIYWTINPLDQIVYFPRPNNALWTVQHEYWAEPQVMAADADIPRMPSKYFMAIVWRAVMFYCGADTNGPLYSHAKEEFDRLMDRMRFSELPKMLSPGSLA